MLPQIAAILLLGLQLADSAPNDTSKTRFCVYVDEWHQTRLPDLSITKGINCVIMAFANSTLFTTSPAGNFKPFMPVSDMRARFEPSTKVMIAIGGWGDTAGFSKGVVDEASKQRFAKNVGDMLISVGADGVDIDWEYPGGNGADYKTIPNSQKAGEVEAFPLLLSKIKDTIGKDKLLSVAVPGKEIDMIGFTPATAPKIWQCVDFVNVMTYDLVNRRDSMTGHHTSREGSLSAIKKYISLGLETRKINLGFAFYAKYFSTAPASNCATQPISCAMLPLEQENGLDSSKSGVVTFEYRNLVPVPNNLALSSSGNCGADVNAKCSNGACCSSDGWCGNTIQHCGLACMTGYGNCPGVSASASYQKALKYGQTDAVQGGQYYWDSEANLFWSWDTPELIAQKFEKIVTPLQLGGVMAWSLGEDTFDWSHLKAIQKGIGAI
ncbi:hypothetical protein AJ80_07252 [Polytolypa hystricis UAMH7299]|uniref:chitinase n=1 Tax=Polytolypa hystricis (strain UAMH7299) TaxID=1447883 RepID=A0A2B7XQA4_POLH7|nr:hypothetical protein AJ80_07252 [Polytolypa hystricis UAMH7299]